GECYAALDRFERDVAGTAGHFDVALHRFRRHGATGAIDADVRVRTAQRHAHPRRHGDSEIDDRGRAAPPLSPHQNGRSRRGHVDLAAARMTGVHLDGVLGPRLYHDLAAEVVDVQAGARLHRKRGVSDALSLSLTAPLSLMAVVS